MFCTYMPAIDRSRTMIAGTPAGAAESVGAAEPLQRRGDCGPGDPRGAVYPSDDGAVGV